MSNQLKLKKSAVGGWEVYYKGGYLHVPGDNLTKTRAAFEAIGVISGKTGESPELIAANIADNQVKAEILSHYNNLRKSINTEPAAPRGMFDYGAPAPAAPMPNPYAAPVPMPQQAYPQPYPQAQPQMQPPVQRIPQINVAPGQLKALRESYCQKIFEIMEPMNAHLRKCDEDRDAMGVASVESKLKDLAGLISRVDIATYGELVYSDWGRALANGDITVAAAIHKQNADHVDNLSKNSAQFPMGIDPTMLIPR